MPEPEPAPAPEEQHELAPQWQAFHASGDVDAREKLVRHFIPFARMLAAKAYARRTYTELEFVDFFQYASVGLLEAVDRFDPARGIRFVTFAAPRISGAILNGIDGFTEKQDQIKARQRDVRARSVAVPEPAKGEDEEQPDDLLALLAELAIGLAFTYLMDEDYSDAIELAAYPDNTYQRVEMQQLRQRVKMHVGRLPPNEAKVITYYYMQQLSFEEIALVLELSKGRISQLHRGALQRLKKNMHSDGAVDVSC